MHIEKIKELAEHLDLPLAFVGYLDQDLRVNVGYRESGSFPDPHTAYKAAAELARRAGFTRLTYGIKAEIGDDIVVQYVEGY